MNEYKRRDILRIAGIGALGTLVGCTERACSTTPQRVLIIGAGMAGLAAGQVLQARGHHVNIIEARARIGGRIHTDMSMGAPVDMGAMLLHGTEHNPLSPLLRKLKQPLHKVDYLDVALYRHQQKSPPKQVVSQVIQLFRQGLKAMPSLASAPPLSLHEAFDLWLQSRPGKEQVQYTTLINKWILPTFGMKEGADLDKIAMFGWADADACPGGDHLLPQSYGPLVAHMRRGLKLHLREPVQAIHISTKGVSVQTTRQRWQGDRVIVTVPLGVLQAGKIQFTPTLPTYKQEAFKALGMGLLNKVALRFPRSFWGKDGLFLGYQSPHRGEFPLWVNMHRYMGAPILMTVAGGPYGEALEHRSNAQITARCMEILREMYGTKIPAPTHTMVSRWRSDPFACGAYSHVPIDGDPAAYDAMALPVADRLFFAGEATHRRYPTTVHGAYLSGIREANRPQFF